MKEKHHLPYQIIDNLFSADECQRIISLWDKPEIGQIFGHETPSPELRISEISWIKPSKETGWIFERIAQVVLRKGDLGISSELFLLEHGLQLTFYNAEKGGHYYFHQDSGEKNTRKLSLSVLLSSPQMFDGGRLEFLDSQRKVVDSKLTQGSVAYFSSSQVHRVSPVLKNVRWSLVGWFSERVESITQ